MFDWLGLGALVAAAGAVLALLMWRTAKAGARRKASRAGFLDACKPLFEGGSTTTAATGFPRMTARYKGHSFDLQVVPDTLTYRKLPALWLLVTLPVPLSVVATFDMMMRPTGIEPFSRFQALSQQITPPPGFPEAAMIRSDGGALPPEALLRRHLGFFDQDRAKEMVISPKGVRLVWLTEEADRTRYLIFRDAEMGQEPLAPAVLLPMLDRLIALRDDLQAASAGQVTVGVAA